MMRTAKLAKVAALASATFAVVFCMTLNHAATVRTAVFCETVRLNKHDVEEVVLSYPNLQYHLNKMTIKHAWRATFKSKTFINLLRKPGMQARLAELDECIRSTSSLRCGATCRRRSATTCARSSSRG